MKVKRIIQMLEHHYELVLRDIVTSDIITLTDAEKEQLGNLFRIFDTSESVVNYYTKRITKRREGEKNET